jgi:hypothetical protein
MAKVTNRRQPVQVRTWWWSSPTWLLAAWNPFFQRPRASRRCGPGWPVVRGRVTSSGRRLGRHRCRGGSAGCALAGGRWPWPSHPARAFGAGPGADAVPAACGQGCGDVIGAQPTLPPGKARVSGGRRRPPAHLPGSGHRASRHYVFPLRARSGPQRSRPAAVPEPPGAGELADDFTAQAPVRPEPGFIAVPSAQVYHDLVMRPSRVGTSV